VISPEVKVERKALFRTRTRGKDINEALKMRVYDPLWMLARQWQMGEFDGNDAASAVSVRCKYKQKGINFPNEYEIERDYQELTPYVRLEAAMHYIQMLKSSTSTASNAVDIIGELRSKFPLNTDFLKCGVDNKNIKDFARSQNTKLLMMAKAFGDKAFDGYDVYCGITNRLITPPLAKEYESWFKQRYMLKGDKNLPVSKWDSQAMRYIVNDKNYSINDYAGGRLSWYSCNLKGNLNSTNGETSVEKYAMPTLATYPNAPTNRLWQFEDHNVYLGNSTDENLSQANVILMQYVSMYSNDMFLIPLETEVGKYIEIEEIEIWDTFGKKHIAKAPFAKSTVKAYNEWGMFDLSITSNSQRKGLLMPAAFQSTIESAPIEEVHFLRDEMANMVWGVETVIPDGAGTTLDGNAYNAVIGEYIADFNLAKYKERFGEEKVNKLMVNNNNDGETETRSTNNAAFRYTIQSRVPLNWIPFLPQQQFSSDGERLRDCVLRRGKMPCYVYDFDNAPNDFLYPVRPTTSLIETTFEKKPNNKMGEKPFYINEEEILQTGIKIVKNYQRARGLNGKVFFWYGTRKQLNRMDANSGLVFDKLTKK
jgi:hypothetical protein